MQTENFALIGLSLDCNMTKAKNSFTQAVAEYKQVYVNILQILQALSRKHLKTHPLPQGWAGSTSETLS